jgi:hypothetical protein
MTLIARGKEDPPPTGYRFSPGQRDVALEVTEEFRKLGDDLKGKDLEEHGPKPEPALRVGPRF